ncbi:hypothetical protein NP233_g3599 [Leucocoprinus birnbaumii]|uniref:Glycoside hydrolase family 92 protein n=1 Tax=Leucocoprinus birnbaumii TaxID=56174 RepID=A0AAD5VW70_9AGAR|nr:hypothetical protein NP233_g3599 [Leucocoprinus birnbaumii]
MPKPGGSPTITDPASFVLPFIGTSQGGNVFPGVSSSNPFENHAQAFSGATLPHGMVKAGLDVDKDNWGGYSADPSALATGFSQLHESGTGGDKPLANFKLWPFSECPSFAQCPTSLQSRKLARKILPNHTPDDFASPGYFSSNLSNDIRVELTATRRTALHRYTFPDGTESPRLLVDITNDAQQSASNPSMTIDPTTGNVIGGATFSASFAPSGNFNAFVCVTFKGEGYDLGAPTEYGAWVANSAHRNSTDFSGIGGAYERGALLTFKPAPSGSTVILARVGVSLISTDQACSNAKEEISSFDFAQTATQARDQWNTILSRVQVDTTDVPPETVQLLYSSLYRTHIAPADYTGENPKWESSEPYYDSFYCNWDTYRTLYPLMSLHDPVTFSQIVRGMIDIQKNEGYLPECREATVKQWVQGGSNGDPILGEFFVKYHDQASSLGVSQDALYDALRQDAEKQPSNANVRVQGRLANDWKELGYVSQDNGILAQQVSRTLEYAFDDFAIAQVAKILGQTADQQEYLKRAQNFKNAWNANLSIPGHPEFMGMMQPKYRNGSFGYTDPRHCSIHDPKHATCYLNPNDGSGFYEGSPIEYSQYVPQDTAALIELQGGADNFVQRLNFIFDQGYFDSTDEPSQQMPFMYHYANKPGLSTQRARQVIAKYFNTSTGGLPGNDDSGAMGSYAAFYLAGLYPVPATEQFLLSSPYFKTISFTNPLYKTTTTITANNFAGNPADGVGGQVFIQSVTVNGQPYKSNCYLDWDVFKTGANVTLTLTSDINVSCGSGTSALPPSISTGGFN